MPGAACVCVCVLHARQMRDGLGNLSARSRGSAREREGESGRHLVGLEGERRQTLSNLQIQFMLAALIYACLESSYRRYRRQHNYLSITNHTHACSAAQTVAPSFVSTETIKSAAGHCQVNQPIKRTLAGARSATEGGGVVLAGECCTTCSTGVNLNAIVTCAGAKSFGNSFAAPLVLSDCGLAGETCRIGQTFVPASKPVGAPPSTPYTLLLSSSCLASFNRDPIQKLLRANVNSFKLQQLTLLLLTNWHALPQKGEGKRRGEGEGSLSPKSTLRRRQRHCSSLGLKC